MEVDFIVVDAYSPYTTIMGRPWLHALENVDVFAWNAYEAPGVDLNFI